MLDNYPTFCTETCSWFLWKNSVPGSVKFWYGSGSSDPYIWIKDPDPNLEPALFVSDPRCKPKILIVKSFLANYIYIILHGKKSIRSRKPASINGFLTFFSWWWEDLDPEQMWQIFSLCDTLIFVIYSQCTVLYRGYMGGVVCVKRGGGGGGRGRGSI
jgi:hypothetical protein